MPNINCDYNSHHLNLTVFKTGKHFLWTRIIRIVSINHLFSIIALRERLILTIIAKWSPIMMALCWMTAQIARFSHSTERSLCHIESETTMEMQFSHDGFSQLALCASTEPLPHFACSFLAGIKNCDEKIWSATVCSLGLSQWGRRRDCNGSVAPFLQFLKAQPKSDPKKVSQCYCTISD